MAIRRPPAGPAPTAQTLRCPEQSSAGPRDRCKAGSRARRASQSTRPLKACARDGVRGGRSRTASKVCVRSGQAHWLRTGLRRVAVLARALKAQSRRQWAARDHGGGAGQRQGSGLCGECHGRCSDRREQKLWEHSGGRMPSRKGASSVALPVPARPCWI